MQSTREHYEYETATVDVTDNRVKVVTEKTIHIFGVKESLAHLFWDYDLFEYYQDCSGEDSCEWVDSLADCAQAIDAHMKRKAA